MISAMESDILSILSRSNYGTAIDILVRILTAVCIKNGIEIAGIEQNTANGVYVVSVMREASG